MEDKNLNGMQQGVNNSPTLFESFMEEFQIILNNIYPFKPFKFCIHFILPCQFCFAVCGQRYLKLTLSS